MADNAHRQRKRKGAPSARLETSSGGVVYRMFADSPHFLLIRDPYENWGLPKGHLEGGETPVEAAVREVAEAVAGPGHRAMATVGGNLCLDTRCIYYNQSEWWRRANSYCLKHGGDTCHVAPQGRSCHAASP